MSSPALSFSQLLLTRGALSTITEPIEPIACLFAKFRFHNGGEVIAPVTRYALTKE